MTAEPLCDGRQMLIRLAENGERLVENGERFLAFVRPCAYRA